MRLSIVQYLLNLCIKLIDNSIFQNSPFSEIQVTIRVKAREIYFIYTKFKLYLSLCIYLRE